MKKLTTRYSILIKIAVPVAIVWGIISLFKAGYVTGQWLYVMTH